MLVIRKYRVLLGLAAEVAFGADKGKSVFINPNWPDAQHYGTCAPDTIYVVAQDWGSAHLAAAQYAARATPTVDGAYINRRYTDQVKVMEYTETIVEDRLVLAMMQGMDSLFALQPERLGVPGATGQYSDGGA